MRIETAAVAVVHVTAHTDWIFVSVGADGRHGIGEATLDGCEAHVVAEVASLEAELVGRDVEPGDAALVPDPDARGGLASAAARSALDQALWDLEGRRAGAPVAELLGGEPGAVGLYANINRSLRSDRTAEAFAAAARSACRDGFTAVKIAPFDGVRPEPADSAAGARAIDRGVERVRAVREAIGPDRDLMIDCHGRFDVPSALRMIERIEDVDPAWIESPVPDRRLDQWQAVRDSTESPLAGGEFIVGEYESRSFLEASGVDVFMSDVKYCGGVSSLAAMANLAAEHGAVLSPHCPSGPIGLAASAHVAAATTNMPVVEYGWGEAEWRPNLTTPTEPVIGGAYLIGNEPGLGLRLDHCVAARHRVGIDELLPREHDA